MVKERLLLGRYEIPIIRIPTAISDVEKIYQSTRGMDDFHITDIARAWNLNSPSSGGFYRRLNSIVLYGLLENTGKARFKISSLTTDILFHEDKRDIAKCKAFFNVPLWSKLYEKVKETPPPSIFSQLNSITNSEPLELKKYDNDIRTWYLEDLDTFPREVIPYREQKSYNTNENNIQDMSNPILVTNPPPQNLSTNDYGVLSAKGIGNINITDEDTLAIAKSVLDILLKKIKENEQKESKNLQNITSAEG